MRVGHPAALEKLVEQLKSRRGEVAEHRAERWLAELDKIPQRSAKERLLPRMDEVTEELATKWLRELDQRLCWPRYRQNQDDFCYGPGFGEFDNCVPFGDHGGCLDYECCKAEYEAEWPEEKF